MNNIIAILKRELYGYFATPVALCIYRYLFVPVRSFYLLYGWIL